MATEQKQKTSGLKDQLAALLHEALMPMKELLGDKKYTNRIRKAVKIITEGIEKKKKHTKDGAQEGAKVADITKKAPEVPAIKKAAVKKTEVKKAVVKKSAPQKKVVKKAVQAKAVPAKKTLAKKAPAKSK